MKNLKIIFFSLSFLFILSCEEEEYAEYTPPQTDFSDVSWLVGLNTNVGAEYQFNVNADTHISFFNLAQGAVSSQWIIEEGNNFLKEGFKTNDSLPLFIDPNAGLTSTNGKAHILFRNSKENKIKLINKFNNPVASNMSETFADFVKETTYEEDGLFVYETEFLFDVYSNLNPAFTVSKDDVEVLTITEDDMPSMDDEANWDVIEIEAATGLTFTDNSTIGRPNGGTWFIEDGVPNRAGNAQPVNINFYKLGTFNVGSFRSLRAAPLPTSNSEKLIPLKVKVVQSTQPFKFDGVLKENENESISFRVNGEINDFAGAEGSFRVHVTNGAFDQDIAVSSAKVSSNNSIFIELKLAAPIYNSDTIEVYYDGSGGITSVDERILEAFGPEQVQMIFGGNILPSNAFPSFETFGGNPNTNANASPKYFIPNNTSFGNTPNDAFLESDGHYVWQSNTDVVYAGTASMAYKIPDVAIPKVNLFGFGLADGPDGVPAGSYRVFYWVYIEPGTTLNAFTAQFGNPVYSTLSFDISEVERGKWVPVEGNAPLVINPDLTPGKNARNTLVVLAQDNPGVTGPQMMYFDELTFIELETRP